MTLRHYRECELAETVTPLRSTSATHTPQQRLQRHLNTFIKNERCDFIARAVSFVNVNMAT